MLLQSLPLLLLLAVVCVFLSVAATTAAAAAPMTVHSNVGARDRFWKHHVDQKSLVWNGENHYLNIDQCWKDALTAEELKEYYNPATTAQRKVARQHSERVPVKNNNDNKNNNNSEDDDDEEEEEEERLLTYAVVLENAITPVHAKAVQALAKCVRKFLPHLYESRAMYIEFDLEEDEDHMGGNCPTHLAPLVSVFLPQVAREQQLALQAAYDAAGWKWWTDRDLNPEQHEDNDNDEDSDSDDEDSNDNNNKHKVKVMPRDHVGMPPPDQVGIRASEHLTYEDFPSLALHYDGASKYTMNFAFSGPEDYQGGEFFLLTKYGRNDGEEIDEDDETAKPPSLTFIKPNQYGAIVFLGGRYEHGVTEITGGHREMWSTEYWFYPDLPFGATLWNSYPVNMEQYISRCDREFAVNKTIPCQAEFPSHTISDLNRMEDEQMPPPPSTRPMQQRPQQRPKGKIRPKQLTPIRFYDETTHKVYDLEEFRSEEDEPDFLVPDQVERGEMVPIRWRDTLEPVDGADGESFVIGFPPELHEEFVQYVEKSGMMDVARNILYHEEKLEDGQHRLYTLEDGNKWGAMIPGGWRTDMIWLDPADEDCFESLISLLGRGGFDSVLDQVGKAFDLDGLMIQGIGAIFLSHKKRSSNMHKDIPGSKGSFYNIIVPVYIPDDEVATLYVGDSDREGTISLDPNVGVVLGGESLHGTGECDYREQEDFRLSFAIYVADINEKTIDLIASDSTSLWPTQGDTDWFWSQQGRFWTRDGTKSLKGDTGRKPLHVEDHDVDCPSKIDLCESDPLGWRLKCPKTCKLYLEDEVYYAKRTPKRRRRSGNVPVDETKMPSAKEAAVDHAKAQIDWIRARGGFFSPKLEVRRFNQSDPNSPYGVFTNGDLSEEEEIMVIPRACILTGEGSEDICDTTRNLLRQSKLKDQSEFAPYVNYVLDPKHSGQVPSSWSSGGKALLERIIGRELPPQEVADISFREHCGGSGHPFEENAFQTVVRRSWDDKMLPVFDMVNHRNGKWFNTDSTSAHDEDNDVRVFARKPVMKGEQLYLSYNECVDCEDYALTYVLQDILKDYGFVEDYPQRWRFHSDDDSFLVFEVDKNPATAALELKWLTELPDPEDIAFLRGHLRRLDGLEGFVSEQAKSLASKNEKLVSIEFYNAMKAALDLAVLSVDAEGNLAEQCNNQIHHGSEGVAAARTCDDLGADSVSAPCTNPDGSDSCVDVAAAPRVYDELESPSDTVDFSMKIVDYSFRDDSSYEIIDHLESQYSDIAFEYSEELQDTCLHLNQHLQACASFRPHYHEVFVHYPARFVEDVKRVAFIGGGDNMIVHEILKYPSLEVVVGLELDHEVVRSSFRNLGTQPHWDNNKVEWWYGDGSKSILMLPKEYYGSFDLVLLDLQTEVVDMLKVGEEHNIMDAAWMLLKPAGVMARNEDWFFGSNKPFAKYMVDLFYVDVPVIAHQGITLASETVDFMTHPQKDHNIETVYLEAVDDMNRFDRWYNYRQTDTGENAFCKEGFVGLANGAGSAVLMIHEAEDARLPEEPADVQQKISQALKTSGLTETSVSVMPKDEAGQSALVFLLEEGYAVARFWQGLSTYCGFELMLWSGFEKLNTAKSALSNAIDSQSSSSYRLVLNDVYQSDTGDKDNRGFGPNGNITCEHRTDHHPDLDKTTSGINQSTIDMVYDQLFAPADGVENSVLVVCGEVTQPCHSLDVLKNSSTTKVTEIFTCPNVSTLDAGSTNSSQIMLDCETLISTSLNKYADTAGLINAIVIDPMMPRAMGQVFLAALSNNKLRRKLLSKDHTVLSITSGSTESWRKALLDRFRTSFAVFEPAHQAEVLLENNQVSLELNVFSAGDSQFFSHLTEFVANVEKATNLVSSVKHVKNGVNNYVADFEPSMITSHDDYDASDAVAQMRSQHVLGQQTMLQFEVAAPVPSITAAQIKDGLVATLNDILSKDGGEGKEPHIEEFYKPGQDGCAIFVVYWKDSSAIVLWNGKSVITLDLFTPSDESILGFEQLFASHIPTTVARKSLDLLPRGYGRVVSFLQDAGEELPHWA